jgi:hypothetical protein
MDQERGWQGFALGLAAGCGLCLKPQYALAAAALEGYWLLWTRRFRILRSPELFGLVAVPVLYLLHFVLLPAAMRDAFLHRWLPLVAARYSIYDVPLATMVTPSIVLSTLLAGVAIVAALRLQERVGVMIGALGVFTGAAVAVYFLQHKGWPYHPLPAFGGTALLLVLLGACLVSQTTPRRPRDLVVPLLLGIVWTIVVRQGCVMDFGVWEPPLASLLKRYTHRGEPVLILSPNVVPAYPLLVHEDRRPGSRYLWSFTIPMLAAANPASAAGRPEWIVAAEQAFLRDLNDDIEARKPPLILIQSSEQWAPLSVLRYLDGSVVAETVTRTYVRLPDTIGFAVFVAPDRLSGEHQAPS